MTSISEIIGEWLGWCPNKQRQIHTETIRLVDEATVPSARGTFKDRVLHWFGLFRNQNILSAIGAFCAGVFLFVYIGGGSYPYLFLAGFLAGLPLSAIFGIWYWRIFNKVLDNGPVKLRNRHDKILVALSTVPPVIIVCIPVLVLFGMIPGVNLKMITTLYGGMVVVTNWGILIAIQIWESRTHRQLHSDGNDLSLEKGDSYAVR
jgi:hypothetical protein